MKNKLTDLESQLEDLFEGAVERAFGRKLAPETIVHELDKAMLDGVKERDPDRTFAPDQFALTLHPKDADRLYQKAPDLQDLLGKTLLELARRNGLSLGKEPHLTIAADPTLEPQTLRVIAWHSTTPLDFTQTMPEEPAQSADKMPDGAFLIIDGGKHFPLDRPVINIGRRIDNQIILEDSHVSRTHAQLRVKQGRFVLFDLGSTAGTMVNGRRVKQHILRPGDVITIARIRLVYGEDPGGPPGTTDAYTPPFPPQPAGDQRTRTQF